jgi:hypothetical protein
MSIVIIVLASLIPRRLLGIPFRAIRVTARNTEARADCWNKRLWLYVYSEPL